MQWNIAFVLSRFSGVSLFATPWTVAHQAPLSMGILQVRILEWVLMPFSRGYSPPGIKPGSPALLADSLPAELPGSFKINLDNLIFMNCCVHIIVCNIMFSLVF